MRSDSVELMPSDNNRFSTRHRRRHARVARVRLDHQLARGPRRLVTVAARARAAASWRPPIATPRSVLDPFDGERSESGGRTVLTAPVTPQNASRAPPGAAGSAAGAHRPGDVGGVRRPSGPRDARARERAAVRRRRHRAGVRAAVDSRDDAHRALGAAGHRRRDVGRPGGGLDGRLRRRRGSPEDARRRGRRARPRDSRSSRSTRANTSTTAPTPPATPTSARPGTRSRGAGSRTPPASLLARYAGTTVDAEGVRIAFDERTVDEGRREVRPRHRARGDDVPPRPVCDGRPAVRPRGVGGRDGDADLARRARLRREGAAAARRRVAEPRAALRRPLREGRGLHRRRRGDPRRRRRARGHRAGGRPVQDQPALRLGQVQHLRRRGDARRAASCI